MSRKSSSTRSPRIGAVVAALAACALVAAGAVGKDDTLKIHLRLIDPPKVLHVGDKIKVGMILENLSDSAKLLPDSNSVRFLAQWYSNLQYETFPGKTGDLHFGPVGENDLTPDQGKEVFSPLAPKAKTPEVVDTHVFLLPGKALLEVAFDSQRATRFISVSLADGTTSVVQGVWSGWTLAEMPLVISDEISPGMKQQYDRVRALLAAPDRPDQEKLKALAEVAGQKHLFAARFVREIWQGKASPAIKAAALEHMASLLELGTAYESLGDLLDVLADESAPAPIRRRILAVMPDLKLVYPNPGLRVEDQGYYELPAALCDKAMQAIRAVSKGRDPFLAVEARKVLEWPRWGGIRPIPPVTDRATTIPTTAPS